MCYRFRATTTKTNCNRYGHRHIYDERELREVSARAGWTEANGCSVVRAGFRESAMGDEALAALDDAVHKDESIYMEM